MIKQILPPLLFVTTGLSFTPSAFSYDHDQTAQEQPEKYDKSFKRKYKRYKGYSPDKKKRVQKKWNSFKQDSNWKGLSPEQKKRLRERVLNKKKKPNY